jgi:SAM-dependent methyltransferase
MRSYVERLRRSLTRVPPLPIARLSSFADYRRRARDMAQEYERRAQLEAALAARGVPFYVDATCYPCRRRTRMLVDGRHSFLRAGKTALNWRERLLCERCGLSSRQRATLQIFEQECRPARPDRIYATEQASELCRQLQAAYPNVAGSEFLGDAVPLGSLDSRGIRNESITALSFADRSLDFVLSFDVLEHVADYERALAQVWRVLRPGGRFLFSAPFRLASAATIVRARLNADGSITHLRKPSYHSDPFSTEPILCFQTFGWDLLESLGRAGFSQASALLYWSEELGHLGTEQVIFLAAKDPVIQRG